jgi:cytochrome c oxidase subunit 2
MRNNSRFYSFMPMLALTLSAALSGCSKPPQKPVLVKVQMEKFDITPAEIHVHKGDLVQFEVSTKDVQHGFDIPSLGIKEPVQPGKPAVFTYKADKAGTYEIECGIICGPMHDDMRGKLVVE